MKLNLLMFDSFKKMDTLRKNLRGLEAERDRCREINRLLRKDDLQGIRAMGLSDTDILKLTQVKNGRIGYPPSTFRGFSNNIRRIKFKLILLENMKGDEDAKSNRG